ncbi:MAG: hypothetical protein NVSMB49_19570 [Ktedonobacteraceae bacterium]
MQSKKILSDNITVVIDTDMSEKGSKAVLPRSQERWTRQLWTQDPWLTTTILTAYIISISTFWYFFQKHQIVLYGDTYAHMLIVRRVFDNATPGLAQLGGVWLPLPHLVMLPFIWNDYLWRTGIAGSLPSMICYLISAIYLFLAARRLTKDSRASFIGTLLFILNPNVLYLQSTALSEIVLIATLTASSYYFLAWVQDEKLNDLILAALATFLATLSRYDGWALFLAMLVMIIVIGLLKRLPWKQIEANVIVFCSMGGLGIALWFLWCRLIFGDPLFFQRGPFSSQAQQKALIDAHVLFTYHDLWQSIRYYTIDSVLNVGLVLFVLGIIAIGVFVVRRGISTEMFAGLIFLVPFAFYVVSLYLGQAALYVPGAVPPDLEHQIYNARYGVQMVAPTALFLATLISNTSLHRLHTLAQFVLIGVIIGQTIWIASHGIISLEDGQFGLSCSRSHQVVIYLAQHYNGGKILEDLYDTKIDALNPEAGIDFKNVIYEGSGPLWPQALHNPSSAVNWIIINPANKYDQVTQHIAVAFNEQYTRDIEEPDGLSLYHRNGLVLPTRPIPTFFLDQHMLCVDHNSAS